jgi:hypothetical protein
MNIELSITEAQYDLEDDDPKSLISAVQEFGCIGEWHDDYEPQPDGTTRVTMSLETRNRLSDEEALELRAWIAEVGGKVEEGVLMAFIAGCSNPFSPATRFELQEIIEEMEGVMESPETWNQLFDHQRKDVEDTLEMAQSALATFDTGDVTWIGQDDDGYWFRYLPRAKAEGK